MKLPHDWNKDLPVITHLTPMTIDQIAEEAAKEIAKTYPILSIPAVSFLIKSAINKIACDAEGVLWSERYKAMMEDLPKQLEQLWPNRNTQSDDTKRLELALNALFRIKKECEAIDAAIEKATRQKRKAHEDTLTAAKHSDSVNRETIRQLRIAKSDDTKRLEFWLKLCGDGEHAHTIFFDREAIDDAMKREYVNAATRRVFESDHSQIGVPLKREDDP